MKSILAFCSVALMLCILSGSALPAQPSNTSEKVEFSGDLRLRAERDYNVTGKEDRDRLRYRFRFSIAHKRASNLEISARLASGSPTDQQSPHQTLGDDFGKKSFYMDKVYLKYAFASGWVWFGKNSFPFWKQNEMFWDDDVNPEGVSASYRLSEIVGAKSEIAITAGHYIIDDFNDLFESSLTATQARINKEWGTASFTTAVGYFVSNNNKEDTETYNPLDRMDHEILVIAGQLKLTEWPITIGGDYMKNLQEPEIAGFEGETNGFVAQASLGGLSRPGAWLLGAYYVHIEKYAVVAHFAQDDWWRLGSGHTDSSDLEGLEIRLGYQLSDKIDLIARHYVTEAIKSDTKANRFRIDLNVGF